MTAKRRWFTFALVALMVGVASRSHAQDYPSRFIRVIVGPGPDITARLFGTKITEALGQQVVIEPRPGAGGTIAAQAVAGAPPDGYTLLLASASYTINTAMGQSPLDLGRDFAPIVLLATVPFVLVVHPSVEAKNLAELVTLAKARPGKLNYASSGIGTPPHLAGELFKSMAGIDVVHVPFREANSALNAVVSGAVEMMFSIASTAASQIDGAKVRGIAVTSMSASPLVPGLPAMAEAGLPASRCWDGTDWWRPRERRRRRSGSSIRPCNAASTTASCASGSWRRATSRRRAIRLTTSRASSTPTPRNGWRWWNRPR